MNLSAENMRKAFDCLDQRLVRPIKLILGGGGAMLLAHHFPLQTSDVDAIPASGSSVEELDPLVKDVAKELGLAADWLNPYFSTFTHVLPDDYGDRLQSVWSGARLTVLALSKDDLLIMKCFAGRLKDRQHAKALLERGARVRFVEAHLESLKHRRIPGAEKALDFLDEVLDVVNA